MSPWTPRDLAGGHDVPSVKYHCLYGTEIIPLLKPILEWLPPSVKGSFHVYGILLVCTQYILDSF